MTEKNVSFFSADGTPLHGIVATPPDTPKGAVVLAHGITVEKNEGGFYTRLAEVLATRRWQSLRFDFRGHGESGGRPQDMTIEGEINDLSAAVDLLRQSGWNKVGIVGTSFGAGVAVFHAQRRRETVSRLALLAPVLDYRRTFLTPETEWAKEWFTAAAFKRAEIVGTLDLDGFLLGLKLLEELRRLSPADVLLSLNVPTLIVHGTDDSMVPYSVAKEVAAKYEHGRFLAVYGADHGLEGFEETIFSEVSQWVTRNRLHPTGA